MAVDYFLKIDEAKGESQDKEHKDEIEIESFSWGAHQLGTSSHGGGMGAGKVSMQDFNFVMRTNKAAPFLFLHCANGRHHSLAIFEMPSEAGCIHVMAEVPDMAEVGRALDRVQQHGVKLSATLGQHCNDRMTSFYMKTPGGFDLEYGHGGLVVDWGHHAAYEATRVSLWGHDFSIGYR